MKAAKETIETKPATTGVEKPAGDGNAPRKLSPVFVEAEKMFEKMAEITNEITSKAFEFFRLRGGELGRELDDWFRAEREVLRPAPVEIRETNDNFFVSVAVPGFKPEEIEVSVKDDLLVISGKTEAREEKKDSSVVLKEWKSDRIFRRLTLPAPVLEDKVEARLKNGVLELTLPKAAEHDATKVAVAAG